MASHGRPVRREIKTNNKCNLVDRKSFRVALLGLRIKRPSEKAKEAWYDVKNFADREECITASEISNIYSHRAKAEFNNCFIILSKSVSKLLTSLIRVDFSLVHLITSPFYSYRWKRGWS